MREYDWEPMPGLPERLPEGEAILWQGAPDWRSVAVSVLHLPWVAVWFVGVASLALVAGGTGITGALVTLAVGVLALAVVAGLAFAQARTTLYTLTNRRIVLRFGVALTKCVNLPLKLIASADAKPSGFGCHDLALATTTRFPLAYMQMWPHVRPWRLAKPVPMLRGLDAGAMQVIAATLTAANVVREAPVARPMTSPVPVGVAA